MARTRLTARLIEGLKPEGRETHLWDAEVPGLGLRIRPSGAMTWIYKRGRRWTLGPVGTVSLPDARTLARRTAMDLIEGRKPTVGLAASRETNRISLTVNDLLDRYLTDHATTRCTPSTGKLYERVARLHLRPALGKMRIDDVGAGDVDALLSRLSKRPQTANLAFDLLRAAFRKGLRWSLRSKALGSPCEGAERFEVDDRGTHLNPGELRLLLTALGEMLSNAADRAAVGVLLALASTGCRRDEMRQLDWSMVDWSEGRVRWPRTKTGAGELLLSEPAIALLDVFWRAAGKPAVGPAFAGPRPRVAVGRDSVYRRWDAAKRRAAAMADKAGMDGSADRISRARPHDLRHSFASISLSAGLSLDEVRRLLRHRDRRSTERYAQWLPDAERGLAARVGGIVPSFALPPPDARAEG